MQRSWLLNLDAEFELAATGAYATSRAVAQQIQAQREHLEWLTRGEPVLDLTRPAPPRDAKANVALCWCPTPSALRRLEASGWSKLDAPSPAVLRQGNDRKFQLRFDNPLPGRRWVNSAELDWLQAIPEGGLRLKRRFGFAGKGQRVIRPHTSDDDRRWIADSLRMGGFLLEPNLTLVEEWSLHGYVHRNGWLLGSPCRQCCDSLGRVTWIARATEPSSVAETTRRLEETANHVAAALHERSYFGPFGIDGFVYQQGRSRRVNPLSDINARFTLGWSIGMGEQREIALDLLVTQALAEATS